MKKLIICLAILSAVYTVCALFHIGTGVYPEKLSACGTVVIDSLYGQKYFDGEHWLVRNRAKTSRGDLALASPKDVGTVNQKLQNGQTYHLFEVQGEHIGYQTYLMSSAPDIEAVYLRDNNDDMRAFIGLILFCGFWFMATRWDKWF